jgi:uncharacterized protein (DUF305 family)
MNRRLGLMMLCTVTFAAACSSHGGSHSTAKISIPAGSNFNVADVEFAQGMIPHHQQAVEMAGFALDSTVQAGPKVLELANRIQKAQGPEIEKMSGWLKDWKQPMMDMGEGHDMGSMDGMMSADEMKSLPNKKGADFDKAWLDMMVRHHEGAVTMANKVTTSGSNTDVKALAAVIITAQQAEIAEMKAELGT